MLSVPLSRLVNSEPSSTAEQPVAPPQPAPWPALPVGPAWCREVVVLGRDRTGNGV